MNNSPESDSQKFSDGLMLPIFAVAAVFLFVILCFYAYNHMSKNKNADGVVVLEGNTENFKSTPSDPGGMQVAHTDKEVFNTVTGAKENIESEKINVIENENPVSKEDMANATNNINPQGQIANAAPAAGQASVAATSEDETGAEDESEKGDIAITPASNEVAATPAVTAPVVAAPVAAAAVKAVAPQAKVTPTLNTVTSTKTAEAAPKAPAAEATIKAPVAVTIKSASASPKLDSKVAAPVKTDVKKETDKKTGETKTVISFRDPPKSMAKKGATAASTADASSGAGTYYVQISSQTSKADAEAAWKKFAAKFAGDIKGSSKNITEAEVKDKTYYRLSFGPFKDRSAASTKCGILKTKGQDCIIQKY